MVNGYTALFSIFDATVYALRLAPFLRDQETYCDETSQDLHHDIISKTPVLFLCEYLTLTYFSRSVEHRQILVNPVSKRLKYLL